MFQLNIITPLTNVITSALLDALLSILEVPSVVCPPGEHVDLKMIDSSVSAHHTTTSSA